VLFLEEAGARRTAGALRVFAEHNATIVLFAPDETSVEGGGCRVEGAGCRVEWVCRVSEVSRRSSEPSSIRNRAAAAGEWIRGVEGEHGTCCRETRIASGDCVLDFGSGAGREEWLSQGAVFAALRPGSMGDGT
jgi:hypothetical protein